MRNFEDEDARGEEEEFYDSLDRILSSSCSSTSASTSEEDAESQCRRRRRRRRRPPCGHWLCERPRDSSMYDVWISEPSSVAERRRRLLWQMGLFAGSSTLRKHGDRGADGEEMEPSEQAGLQAEMERLAFCDGIHGEPSLQRNSPPLPSISRSTQDAAMDCSSPNHHSEHKAHASPEEHPPPSSRGNANASHEDSESERDDRFENGYNHQKNREFYFTIKNLNNGEKFVVKELREDGMWKRLREVGTGRQLTMEEFQASVIGLSPIVQELMRRQSVEEEDDGRGNNTIAKRDITCSKGVALIGDRWMRKKKGSLLWSLKTAAETVIQRKKKQINDEHETSSEKWGRRWSSTTEDSLSGHSIHGPERIKVRKYGKSSKDLTALYMKQEIQAHKGAIWSMKFNLDGRYLASAGEDRIIRIWQVIEKSLKDGGSGEIPKASVLGKSQIVAPECVFALSEDPICSFNGHLDDVLDLSWSKSEYLLSSSMDKTVRLWHVSSDSCLKIFTHSDYVTCIQFNPADDNYFISGSLDAKVRIWSIQDRQVVHWIDLREMITAVCFRPDGQVALVGSHKGSCHLYDTSENKLHRKGQINMQNKKRSRQKKITGFQFAPGSSSEVLVTSADSRIRVVNGVDLVHKFKAGIRNTSSQITASFTADGEYVICPSEDSHVCMWRYDVAARASRKKTNSAAATRAYEHFYCKDVTAAVPWCGPSWRIVQGGRRCERASATWPEEKLLAAGSGGGGGDAQLLIGSAWGMVIVTAGRGGEIRTFQNFGRLSR